MRAFVDSIHDGQVRLLMGDDETVTVTVPISWLPAGIREGTVLRLDIFIDEMSTENGQLQVQKLLDSMGDEP